MDVLVRQLDSVAAATGKLFVECLINEQTAAGYTCWVALIDLKTLNGCQYVSIRSQTY